MILTHLDQDHVSGVRELLEEGFLIDTILISAQTKADKKWRDWEKLLEEGKVSEQVIEPGQGLALGEARLFLSLAG